jgi:hypothetical protein
MTTDKPISVTAVIRRLVLQHPDASTKDLQAKVEAAGFANVKLSTITTIAADTKATVREATALGMLRTATEPETISSQNSSLAPAPSSAPLALKATSG